MSTRKAPSESVRFTLESVDDISTAEELWRTFDASEGHSFFVSWTWLGTWLRLVPSDFKPVLLRAEKGGETVAAAFLIRRRERRVIGTVRQLCFNSTGEKAFDCVTVEYNGFSGPGSFDPDLWPAFLGWFAANPQNDELIVPGVAAESRYVPSSSRVLESKRNVSAFQVTELAAIAESGIESLLSRNSRQQLRRSMRDYLEAGPLRIDEARDVDTAQAYFSALRNLHIRSWTDRGKSHAFRHPFFEKFHRALIATGVHDGSVQLLRVTAGDQVIGYLYNFRRGKHVYAYQSGFDARNAFRPGYVCHALAIEYNAAKGVEIYDFLAGENRLKQSFANSSYVMSWCSYRQRKLRFQAEMLARSAWSAAKHIAAARPGGTARAASE